MRKEISAIVEGLYSNRVDEAVASKSIQIGDLGKKAIKEHKAFKQIADELSKVMKGLDYPNAKAYVDSSYVDLDDLKIYFYGLSDDAKGTIKIGRIMTQAVIKAIKSCGGSMKEHFVEEDIMQGYYPKGLESVTGNEEDSKYNDYVMIMYRLEDFEE